MYIYKTEECMTGSLPFSISKGEFKAGHEVEIHKHEFIELVYITSGKSTHYINDISYEANSGDIVFVNYNETHRIVANEPLEYYNLFVKMPSSHPKRESRKVHSETVPCSLLPTVIIQKI